MRVKSPQEVGKEIESEFRDTLIYQVNHYRLSFERLYDTGSAGSYLPEMPCDFIVGYQGVTHLIELKSSNTHRSLAHGRTPLTSLVKPGPTGKLNFWRRAGVPIHFIFVNQKDRSAEWWRGDDVLNAYFLPGGKLNIQDCKSFEWVEIPDRLIEILSPYKRANYLEATA